MKPLYIEGNQWAECACGWRGRIYAKAHAENEKYQEVDFWIEQDIKMHRKGCYV